MKKRIYSKDKTPKYIPKKHIDNSFDLLCKIKNLPNNQWQKYIKNIVWDETKEDDFKNIINEIPNKNLQKAIIVYLINIENFDPFSPNFNLIEQKDYKNLIVKKEKYYKEYKNFHKKLTINNEIGIVVHTSFYDKKIEVPFKIIFNSHSRKLMFKYNGTKIFDVKEIYKELDIIEPNKWTHNKSYTSIFTKNEMVSNIEIVDLVYLLKKYTKKTF